MAGKRKNTPAGPAPLASERVVLDRQPAREAADKTLYWVGLVDDAPMAFVHAAGVCIPDHVGPCATDELNEAPDDDLRRMKRPGALVALTDAEADELKRQILRRVVRPRLGGSPLHGEAGTEPVPEFDEPAPRESGSIVLKDAARFVWGPRDRELAELVYVAKVPEDLQGVRPLLRLHALLVANHDRPEPLGHYKTEAATA